MPSIIAIGWGAPNHFISLVVEKNEKDITVKTEKNYKDNSIKNNTAEGNLTPEPYPHWTIKEIEEQEKKILSR